LESSVSDLHPTKARSRATRAAIRGRVACALSKPLAGDERPEVLRWLGGLRRLDGLVLPLGVVERERLDDEAA
jgi:hypothetical protein